MRSYEQSSSPSSTLPPASPSPPAPPSVFSPEFQACLDEREESSNGSAADHCGPWRCAAVPGRPGLVGVLRVWEDLELGDVPRAVFEEEELAWLYAAALPLLGREPVFRVGETAGPDGFPVIAADGEREPRALGALARYEHAVAEALDLLQGIARSPAALAAVIEAAGPGALVQVGQILAGRWGVEQ
jgi:hypothetical protein